MGQEFGICLGKVRGCKCKYMELEQVGAGRVSLFVQLIGFPMWSLHMGYIGLPDRLVASGSLGNFHSDLGSSKEGGGCITFPNLIMRVMQCHFFFIGLV